MYEAHNDYQANEILTATPAKLHQLLLEGAARKTRQAIQCLERDNDPGAATDAVIMALKIMSELMGSLNPSHNPQLVKQVAGEYVFIVRSLSEGNLHSDPKMLRDALRIIEMQHETWRLLNQQLQQEADQQAAAAESVEQQAPPQTPIPPLFQATAESLPITAADDEPLLPGGLTLDV